MIYIENEGVLFRGLSRSFPKEVWGHKTHTWHPYTGSVPKPIEWGDEISAAEAINTMMGAMPTRSAAPFARRRSGGIR
jgi:hypothetical protein